MKVVSEPTVSVYQFKIHLLGISPQIWRRVRIRSDSSLRDLHEVIQLLFGWDGYHLHRFFLHGTDFGNDGNATGDSRRLLSTFQFRLRERFLYEYDFFDLWQHEVRLEKVSAIRANTVYPYCRDGQRSAPEEEFGGPATYMERQTDLRFRAVFGRVDLYGDPDNQEEDDDRPIFDPEYFDKQALNQELSELFNKSAC
jgi:hypothetical protein